ncbi:MAG TPA: serine/threonine-protein kinase [Streptosporangiaceae bacterium]|nr:serine/threonine-protein kinase [Streptosporangiaceae bacterium]
MVVQNTMPERLGPYLLMERIGEGGMGVVHLARDNQGRAVAVKVLRPGMASDVDARRRLEREFETMRRVRSPFVAEVIDADVTGEMPYVVTRYVAGPTLDQMIRNSGPLSGRALERVAWGLAEGLAAVHAAGVVHRDLKPGNVVMAGGSPVLIDFGIAHAPDATRITQAGMFMGTPGYLAPEVVEGQACGPSADVHSWASTVAYAATGRPPFGTGSYETIFYRILGGNPDLNGIPGKLMPLLAAALNRDPAARPSAMQLSEKCAAIDLTGPDEPFNGYAGRLGSTAPEVIGPANGAILNGAAGPGTRLDGLAIRDGALNAGLRPGTRELPVSPPPAGWNLPRPDAGRPVKDNFADLLPPVPYSPLPADLALRNQAAMDRPNGALPAAKVPAGRSSSAQSHTGYRRVLSLITMAIAVAASVLLPVAGVVVSLLAIVLLRAADLSHSALTRRRSARGTRPSDLPVMIIKSPWAVLRAMLGCLLLAPLAATAGALAAAVTIIAHHASPLPAAGAYAAGAFVAFYGFGPGSGTPRRQLGRLFGAVARRRFLAAIVAIVVAVVAVGTAYAALTQPHHIWPLTSNLSSWHLRGVYNLIVEAQTRLQHL